MVYAESIIVSPMTLFCILVVGVFVFSTLSCVATDSVAPVDIRKQFYFSG